MKIDAHQHFWNISRGDYGWITENIPTLYRDFGPEDLTSHLSTYEIEKTVLVQAAPTIEETKFLLSLSENEEIIAGVVGWLDLENEHYQDQLAMFMEHPKFLGVRIMIQDMEDETILLDPTYFNAMKHLADIDIPVDLLVTHKQLDTVVKLLNSIPHLRGVIDHIGKPDIKNGQLDPWRENIRAISKQPKIYCKISGMVTEANSQWTSSNFEPYIYHVYHCFGSDRIMFGSDWPVCLLAGSYDEVVKVVKENLYNTMNSTEQERFFGENARRFYKLK